MSRPIDNKNNGIMWIIVWLHLVPTEYQIYQSNRTKASNQSKEEKLC